jgi:hypothetical protein
MVASKVSSLSFDSSFFMTGPRVTKDSFVLPMRAEGDESFGLLSPMTAQNLFDGARQIVVFMCPAALCSHRPVNIKGKSIPVLQAFT